MVVMECFNDISIMSWNIRGTVGRCTWRHIRDLVKSHHPSIFLIMKRMGLSAEWTNSGCLLARNQCSFKKLIWVLSCIQNIQFLLMENSTQAITFKIERRNFSWFCSAIYASPNPAARKLLWNQFMDISHLCTGP